MLSNYEIWNNPKEEVSSEELKDFDLPLDQRKLKFLSVLNDQIKAIEELEKLSNKSEDGKKGFEEKCSGVPDAATLDRLLRYSASLERDFDRTLNQLERLQRMRKGQPVPPPLNVNVTT